MARGRRRQKIRADYSKIAITDINKLKSLAVMPFVEEGMENEYYVEPVTIEYYIPKESRFAYEQKFLYIELYDPKPKNEHQEKIFHYFKEKNEPIDVMEITREFPEYSAPIYDSYNIYMDLHEKISEEYKSGLAGDNPIAIRRALYLNEVIRKIEPKYAALEYIGDYTTYNINWCIRFLNKNSIEHVLEDKTVEYLIKLHRLKHEEEERAIDERFNILTAIYLEQAHPFDDDIFDEDEWD